MSDQATTLKQTNMVVVVLALCILLVAASKGYFRADDFGHLQVTKFDVMRNPATIVTEFSNAGHYRPVEKVYFWVSYLLFGLEPLGYFVVAIAMFLLTVYVFSLLVKAISGNVMAAYSAVLLFLLQANVFLYTVNWIATATDMLSALFIVGMLYFYVKSTTTVHRASVYYFLSLVSFGLGLLSREIVIVVLPALLAYDFLFLWLESPEKLERAEILRRRVPYHVLFWALLASYLLARSAVPGTRGLLGGGGYTFVLDSNVLANLVFYGMQLGFLPFVVLLLSAPSLFLDKLQLTKFDFKLVAWGMFLAMSLLLPFLFFKWYSPTWMYLPAFGTTLAFSTLFRRVFGDCVRKRRTLLLYGTLICALAGSLLLFSRLKQDRWWQWGEYSRNVIEQVRADYPSLPPGATLCFVDKDGQEPYGISGLFRYRSYLSGAFRVWYDDPSLRAYVVDEYSAIEASLEQAGDGETASVFVFEYDEGVILDKTEWFQESSE